MKMGVGGYVWFAAVLSAAVVIHVYVYRRLATHLGLAPRARRLLAAILTGAPLLVVASRLASHAVDPSRSGPFVAGYAVGFSVVIVVAMIAACLLPIDLVLSLVDAVRKARGRRGTNVGAGDASPTEETPALATPQLGRRELLLRGSVSAATSIATVSTLHGALVGRHDYALEEHALALPNLSPALEGYTIVQLSDLHLGPFVGEAEIGAAVSLVRRARPDVVVLTGDLLDHDPRYAPLLGELVRRLSTLARDGVVAIPGNHDYYAGIDIVVDTVTRASGTMLRNRGLVLGDARHGVALLGVDDPWGRKSGGPGALVGRTIASVPEGLPRVLLAHQPVVFERAKGRVDVQLSGHTHGGQISLGVNPAYVVLPHGWVRGFYELEGSRLYVNRGFGTAGPPTRVGSSPEVTRFVLTRA